VKKTVPAANPQEYVNALSGWQRGMVEHLRAAVVANTALDEGVKWGHLVYYANGPVLLIRAETARVIFGFWRGKRLREIEARMKPGGKYEMARIDLLEGDDCSVEIVSRLTKEAVTLNLTLGDPTDI
jgi:hypothetical protein